MNYENMLKSDNLELFAFLSGCVSLLFWLIVIFADLSLASFLISFLLALFSLTFAVILFVCSVVNVDKVYEKFLKWNRERKIAKFKGEN